MGDGKIANSYCTRMWLGKILPYKALAYYSSAADDEIGSVRLHWCIHHMSDIPTSDAGEQPRFSPGFSSFPASCVASPPSTPSTNDPSDFSSPYPRLRLRRRARQARTPTRRGQHHAGMRGATGLPQMVSSQLVMLPTPSLPRPGCQLTSRFSSNCTRNKNDDTAQARVKLRGGAWGTRLSFLTVDAVVMMSNRERDIKAKPGDEDEEAGCACGGGRFSGPS